jgi:hypothetical protein
MTNLDTLTPPRHKAHVHFEAAKTMGECCSNCRKRWEVTCSEYKENRRRPRDNEWCAAWRAKK